MQTNLGCLRPAGVAENTANPGRLPHAPDSAAEDKGYIA